jgi:hypothetical protein
MSGLKERDKYSAAQRAPKLAGEKVAGDLRNPMHFKDDATVEELRTEIQRRLTYCKRPASLSYRLSRRPRSGSEWHRTNVHKALNESARDVLTPTVPNSAIRRSCGCNRCHPV